MKRITDPTFIYRNSAETNIAATFKRIRRQLKEDEKERALSDAQAAAKVKPIRNKS